RPADLETGRVGRKPRGSDQPHATRASGILRRRNQDQHQLLFGNSSGSGFQSGAFRHLLSRSVVRQSERSAAHFADASRPGGASRSASILEPICSSSSERNSFESVEDGRTVRRNEAGMKYTVVVVGKSIEIEFEAKNGTIEAQVGNRHYTLE